jgi:hypothetical protein
MRLSCLYFNRRLIRYIDRELTLPRIRGVENHLLTCGRCRHKLLNLKAGRKLSLLLPKAFPPEESWHAIEAALDLRPDTDRSGRTAARTAGARRVLPRAALSSVVMLALGAVLMAAVLSLVRSDSGGVNQDVRPGGQAFDAGARFNAKTFHPVAIDDIQRSEDPHVVAEGYVADISLDRDDGDLMFKLVDNLDRPGPFVVCEIMDSIKLSPPTVGARVKVYGVSRYDAKADHQWYEVHPVLDIQPASK